MGERLPAITTQGTDLIQIPQQLGDRQIRENATIPVLSCQMQPAEHKRSKKHLLKKSVDLCSFCDIGCV